MPSRFIPSFPPRRRPPITNKSRLRIQKGYLTDAEPIVFDEEDEKSKFQRSVAGVDQEETNEHHLQAVLSAQTGRSNIQEKKAAESAFIPTPDSTGIVDNYETLYPPKAWRDPVSYVKSSATVEDSVVGGLAGGFTYYMDERDKEWLDKNNEEARGEGTCAQGAVTSSTTRMSPRTSRSKGKEPDSVQPINITEDEFELVMGLFEKITHEQTEFLHHSLSTGMAFPAFSEYQDVFSQPLSASHFAALKVPSWVPDPSQLCIKARLVYTHWKERRVERGGQRIIPTLNFDESDTINESYVCFRRRDVKAVRKTRAVQASSTDKLLRLQSELDLPLKLAHGVMNREAAKRDFHKQAQFVRMARIHLANIKRTNPTFVNKEDDALLFDKRRTSSQEQSSSKARPSREPMEIRHNPSQRTQHLKATLEHHLAVQKEKDRAHNWDDYTDYPYGPPPASYPSRLFKSISATDELSPPRRTDNRTRNPVPVRLRFGRGGRMHIDRRPPDLPVLKRPRIDTTINNQEDMSVDNEEEQERQRNMEQRWRFDADDLPAVVAAIPDEQDRELVDDYDAKYLSRFMTFLSDKDHLYLITDHQIPVANKEGVIQYMFPHRSIVRGSLPPNPGSQAVNGASIAIAQRMKLPMQQMHTPVRISSNGGMKTPTSATMASPPNSGTTVPTSGTQGSPPTQQSLPHNGILTASPMAHQTSLTQEAATSGQPTSSQMAVPASVPVPTPIAAPAANRSGSDEAPPGNENAAINYASLISRPKSQVGKPLANGFPVGSAPGMNYMLTPANAGQFFSSLKPEQVQGLRSAFAAATTASPDLAALRNASYLTVPPNGNINIPLNATNGSNAMNLKIPAHATARGTLPAGWVPNVTSGAPAPTNPIVASSPSPLLRPRSVNGMDVSNSNALLINSQQNSGTPQGSPNMKSASQSAPTRIAVNGHVLNGTLPIMNGQQQIQGGRSLSPSSMNHHMLQAAMLPMTANGANGQTAIAAGQMLSLLSAGQAAANMPSSPLSSPPRPVGHTSPTPSAPMLVPHLNGQTSYS